MKLKTFQSYIKPNILNEVAQITGDDKEVKRILSSVIAQLYSSFPLFAPFLEENPWVATAGITMATDGKFFYYNPEFVREVYTKGNQESPGKGFMYIAFIMIHEVMHNTMGHFTRSEISSNRNRWQLATDGEINYILNGLKSDNLYHSGASKESYKEGIEFDIPSGGVLSKEWLTQFPKWKELAGMSAEEIYYKIDDEDGPPPPPPPPSGGCPLGRDPCPYGDPKYRNTPQCKDVFAKAAKGELTQIPCPKGGMCPIPPDDGDDDGPPPPPPPPGTPPPPPVPRNRDRDQERCPFKEGMGPADPNYNKKSKFDNKGRPVCPYADPGYRASVHDLYDQADKGELAQIPCPLDGQVCPIVPKKNTNEGSLPPVPGLPKKKSGKGGEEGNPLDDSSPSEDASGESDKGKDGKPQKDKPSNTGSSSSPSTLDQPPVPGGKKPSGKNLPPVPGRPDGQRKGGGGSKDDTWDDGSPENVKGESEEGSGNKGKPVVKSEGKDPFKEKVARAGEVLEPGDIKRDDIIGEESKEMFDEFGGGQRLPQKELENIGKKMIDRVKERSKQFGYDSRNDHLGAYLRRLLNPPIANWKSLLRQFLEAALYKTRQKYLNKRIYAKTGDYFKREVEDEDAIVRLVVTLDTSGSVVGIEDTLDLFVNEIVHAVTTYDVEETYVIYCDTEISVEKYSDTQMRKFKVNKSRFKKEIHDKIVGGGGTSFVQPFEYLKAKKIKPDAFIYFTDGEGIFPSPKLVTFPTMWVIIDDVNRTVNIPTGLGGRLDIITKGGKAKQVGKSTFGEAKNFILNCVKKII